MISIFNNGSWMRPLNWSLHVTTVGKPFMPFSFYVRPGPTAPSSSSFPQFRKLPAELQLHILHFCDAQTLFVLMQTSSAIRFEAKKLFWSLPDAWYNVNGEWLLGGAIPGYMEYALDFPIFIEQVEVEFENVSSLRKEWEGDISVGPIVDESFCVKERIHEFWQTLRSRFPHTTHVVISVRNERIYEDTPPEDFKPLVQLCPSQIVAFASILRGTPESPWKVERSLWQLEGKDADGSSEWKEIDPLWTRKKVHIPPREFQGPVGAYQNMLYQFERLDRQKDAARLLLIEALEMHYFDKQLVPFKCPNPQCEVFFKQPGEWSLHAVTSNHDEEVFHPDEETRALFDQLSKRQERLDEKINSAANEVYGHWGEKRSPERRIAEKEYLYQLDHDTLYALQGRAGYESALWESIRLFLTDHEMEEDLDLS